MMVEKVLIKYGNNRFINITTTPPYDTFVLTNDSLGCIFVPRDKLIEGINEMERKLISRKILIEKHCPINSDQYIRDIDGILRNRNGRTPAQVFYNA